MYSKEELESKLAEAKKIWDSKAAERAAEVARMKQINEEKNKAIVWKKVVLEIKNPENEISIEDALKEDIYSEVGGGLGFDPTKGFCYRASSEALDKILKESFSKFLEGGYTAGIDKGSWTISLRPTPSLKDLDEDSIETEEVCPACGMG